MSSIKIAKKKEKKIENPFLCKIIDVFVFAILCLFPLVVTDRYFNILTTKYYFYLAAVGLLLAALFIAGVAKGDVLEEYFTNFSWKKLVHSFSVTDWALIAFLLVAAMSTIGSDFVYESFWGNEGRYSGLFLLTFYGIAYFCITRFGKMRRWYIDAFLITGMIVCLLGISDYFQLDLLHFKVDMREEQKFMFTSTIGNINTYTALVGMITAVAAVLFAVEKNWKRGIFYYVCLLISFFALIMGISDNAYLSLAALFGFLPLYLFNRKEGVKRYLIILATFFTALQGVDWINAALPGKVLEIESAFNIIIQYSGLLYIVIGLWLLAAVWYGVDYVTKNNMEIKGNWLRYVWLAVIVLVVAAVAYVCYDANIAGHADRYSAIRGYVIFDDDWGTHRGYIWRNAMESFGDFSLFKKIFGFGPDTFGIILLDKTKNNIYGQTFDNAHNEYLHYLLTVGIAGLVSYLVFLGSYLVYAIRRTWDNPVAMAAMFGVVCYCVQAFVNLNLPIATPIMWMLLTLGALMSRKSITNNVKEE